jgi:hypothetical protein
MPSRSLTVASLLAALVAVPAIALGAAASNSRSFPDSTGENPGAPDITSTTVSNDNVGEITFKINVANRSSLTPDMLLLLFIDTVEGKGDPDSLGADWAIQLTSGIVSLFKWSGADFLSAASQSSLTYSYPASGPVIQVNASDLERPEAFNFGLIFGSGLTENAQGELDFTNFRTDLAPDQGKGFYTYQVLTQFSLDVAAFSVGPKPAKAGKSFSAGLAVIQSDTAGPLKAGAVTCKATISGAAVPVKAKRLRNGVAACVWSLPRGAAGKQVKGSVSVTANGSTASRAFVARVS